MQILYSNPCFAGRITALLHQDINGNRRRLVKWIFLFNGAIFLVLGLASLLDGQPTLVITVGLLICVAAFAILFRLDDLEKKL